jgi:hypothetical protein
MPRLHVREHSAYVSDGSDDYVIRRNVFQGSRSGGLQVNLDPEASLQETMKHPALASAPPPYVGTRAWAEATLARAARLFGEQGFPDGSSAASHTNLPAEGRVPRRFAHRPASPPAGPPPGRRPSQERATSCPSTRGGG